MKKRARDEVAQRTRAINESGSHKLEQDMSEQSKLVLDIIGVEYPAAVGDEAEILEVRVYCILSLYTKMNWSCTRPE